MAIVLTVKAEEKSPKVIDDTYITLGKKIYKNDAVEAAKYLKYSANWELASIGFTAASAGLAYLASDAKRESNKEVYTEASIICGVMAFTSYFIKIHYKWKSGKMLEIYGNGVKLNF